ncbi:MAG: hypothetical protein BZY82_03095 [SAR202 cluster bacterium Io17-Chloro-G3]|nr:MAG: hypothetical protein BZY82_03095 [SAR202 cluster bacterium Io17-Chloro-G3]
MIWVKNYWAYLLLGVLLLLAVGCSGDPKGTQWYYGNTLIARVTDLRFAEEVGFLDEDLHYIIRSSNEERALAAVKMEVRARDVNVVYLSINEDAVTLRDTDEVEFTPINYLERREEISKPHDREGVFSPFLWGDIELPSKCADAKTNTLMECQLVGWFLFEVPRDFKAKLVLWEAADTIYIRF